MPLDLEQGDAKLADDIDKKIEAQVKSQRKSSSSRSTSSKKASSSTRSTAAQRTDTEIVSRLDRTFDRIIVALQERDDDELASAISEDKDAMSRGIVSLTRNVKPLRNPLLMVLNLVEPLLAFGRVGKILLTRWAARRARVMAEREAEAARAPSVPLQPEQAQPWYDNNR
jgi:hypothetical protein